MVMNHFIYADNAATTRLSSEALDAMMPYLNFEYGNASQPYSFARSAKKALREARETIAMCINADPEEIFFIIILLPEARRVIIGLLRGLRF